MPTSTTTEWPTTPTTPTLLTLPFEIRLNIYSFVLINKHIKEVYRGDMNISAYNLAITNHQLNSEALSYYYSNNTFMLDLANTTRLPSRMEETNGEQYRMFCAHLGRVQNLQLKMMSTIRPSYNKMQMEQMTWICDALTRTKAGEDEGKNLLKHLALLMEVCGVGGLTPRLRHFPDSMSKDFACVQDILEPLRGRIGGLVIFGEIMSFD